MFVIRNLDRGKLGLTGRSPVRGEFLHQIADVRLDRPPNRLFRHLGRHVLRGLQFTEQQRDNIVLHVSDVLPKLLSQLIRHDRIGSVHHQTIPVHEVFQHFIMQKIHVQFKITPFIPLNFLHLFILLRIFRQRVHKFCQITNLFLRTLFIRIIFSLQCFQLILVIQSIF